MESKAKPTAQVKVVYAEYNYETSEYRLKFGNAIIDKSGSATIQIAMFGAIKRRPGEYLLAEQFEHDWKKCIQTRAKEMAQKIVEEGGARKS